MDPNESVFETHDIYLAAYFKIAGCVLDRTYNQGRRVIFIFSNPGGSMREMRDAYYSGKGTVIAHLYASEIQACKQMCFPG